MKEVEAKRQTGGNVLFYLSTQPSQYAPAALGIGAAGMGKGNGWRRLIVEKPFGHDLESAHELSDELHQVFNEADVYRIDHYLGKETVQNILAFRFGNGIFEPLWNRRYINHVQITAAESIGVEGRGAYYQEAGALADMIQNHLAAGDGDDCHGAQRRFQRQRRARRTIEAAALDPADEGGRDPAEHSCRASMARANIGGKDVPGFRQEEGVKPDSQTDTYAAATFFVENWRWARVPFYVRTGKRLPKRITEIAIQFNPAPLAIFDGEGSDDSPNLLIVRIQPEEGISLKFLSKRPGVGNEAAAGLDGLSTTARVSANDRPRLTKRCCSTPSLATPTLYTRQDMVEASWRVVEPIQNAWRETQIRFPELCGRNLGARRRR